MKRTINCDYEFLYCAINHLVYIACTLTVQLLAAVLTIPPPNITSLSTLLHYRVLQDRHLISHHATSWTIVPTPDRQSSIQLQILSTHGSVSLIKKLLLIKMFF
jgi:hypothetical protein